MPMEVKELLLGQDPPHISLKVHASMMQMVLQSRVHVTQVARHQCPCQLQGFVGKFAFLHHSS